jgi:hypothetical protein
VIYADSRYADGTLVQNYLTKDDTYHVSVFRNFPTSTSTYSQYVWRESDRMDLVAAKLLGDASLWWRIMDFNPQLPNPMDIPVGTAIRIPHGF